MALIDFTSDGLYCAQAGVYIDPWKPVQKAVITHAHADHARPGMKTYLAQHLSIPVMKHRLGSNIKVQGLHYGETINLNGVNLSMHPSGHIPGAAQVRLEYKGEVWVVSGDYKLENDGISTPFESLKCHHFITESTFGLPVFDWPSQEQVVSEMKHWCKRLHEEKKAAIIYAYSLGKAQRILHALKDIENPIYCHAAVERSNELLAPFVELPERKEVSATLKKSDYQGALILATPGSIGAAWTKKIGAHETAMASGWMRMRGTRRRNNVDKGFVLSDHADWKALNTAVKESGAEKVYVTHGYTSIYSRYLQTQGIDAHVVSTEYGNEEEAKDVEASNKKQV